MKFGLSLKIMLLNVLIILVTAGTLIFFSYKVAYHDLEEAVAGRLMAIAATGSTMIDGDLHDQIEKAEDAESPAFIALRDILRTIKRVNNLETEVYTFRRTGEELRFIVMTNEKPYIGHQYPIKDEMKPALNNGEVCHTSMFIDSYGHWLSAYAPIYNAAQENVGILCIDIRFETFEITLREKIIRLIIVSMAILIFALILSFILSKGLSRKLTYLRDVTEKISLGQMSREIEVQSNDEVGELANSLERMRQSLKLALSMIEDDDD